mmetsp:Transcript_41238/g.90051  ORF Transcript_41238/g.90051 Transcript_41238/m.90051 type:complete len:206 (+) Transcript_41238:215-832(+)
MVCPPLASHRMARKGCSLNLARQVRLRPALLHQPLRSPHGALHQGFVRGHCLLVGIVDCGSLQEPREATALRRDVSSTCCPGKLGSWCLLLPGSTGTFAASLDGVGSAFPNFRGRATTARNLRVGKEPQHHDAYAGGLHGIASEAAQCTVTKVVKLPLLHTGRSSCPRGYWHPLRQQPLRLAQNSTFFLSPEPIAGAGDRGARPV